MKKTAQLAISVFGVLLAVFFSAGTASAYTIASASDTSWATLPPLPSNATFIATFTNGSLVATGTMQSFITYLLWANTGTATSGAPFYWQMYNSNTSMPIDCQSAVYTSAELSIPEVAAGWSNAVLRAFPMYGTACTVQSSDFAALTAHDIREVYTTSPGQPVVYLPYPDWWILTTDSASSTIYEYQNTAIGVSTTSNAVYCDNNFAGLSIGADIANALCNVGAFLFVPSTATVNQYAALTSTLQGKVPFSYYYDVYNIVNNSSASTTQNLPSYGLDLGLIDFASSTALGPIFPAGNFEFFSSSTIDKFLPSGMHDLLYNMMIWAIWLDLMWVLYHKLMPHKAKI